MGDNNTEKNKELSLKERVLRGSALTLFGFGFSRALRLGNHLILAWLLAPEIFGLMALVKVFMQGLGMFTDIGIGPSIIQSKRGHDITFLNTAWSIQVLRGAGLWLITCILAWPFSLFYGKNDPAASQLVYLLPVSGLSVLIGGFKHPVMYTLEKELKIGKITIIQIVSQLVSLATIIIWALIKPSIWALIAGSIVSAFFNVIISHTIIAKHRVRFQIEKEFLGEIISFGRWIMLSTAFTFLSNNMDKLILGKVLSLKELGIYGIATTLTKMALDIATRLGSSIMYPVYSKFQDDTKKLMSIALKSRDIVLWIGFTVSVAMAVGSPLFFQTLWDVRYQYAGVLAQWMIILMWTRILLYTMSRIPLSLGNSKSLFISNVIQTMGIFIAAGIYQFAGLPGFIVGLAIGPIAAHVYLTMILPVMRKEMLIQSSVFSVLTLIAGGAMVFFNSWLETNSSEPVWFVVVISMVILICLISLLTVYRKIKR